jgi:hypothetical protein
LLHVAVIVSVELTAGDVELGDSVHDGVGFEVGGGVGGGVVGGVAGVAEPLSRQSTLTPALPLAPALLLATSA